jgi:hypothetical protein
MKTTTNLMVLVAALILTGCGQGLNVVQGMKGDTGAQGYGVGIETLSVAGLCGATDGVRLTAFQDKNNDGLRQVDEQVTSVTSVCNGSNGVNGSSVTTSVSNVAPSCAAGGYTMSTTSNNLTTSFAVCNGTQGSQGLAGLNGLNGSNGSTVTPIKFCTNDNSSYPEYGLLIGNDVYAVYWGSTPSSSASQAFLSKLTPGSYMSTGGNNCAFTLTAQNTIQ